MKNRIMEFRKLFSIILLLISFIAPVADSMACDTCYDAYGHSQRAINQETANVNQGNISIDSMQKTSTFNDDVDQCICPVCSSAAEVFIQFSKVIYSPASFAEHTAFNVLPEPVFPINKPPLV